MRLDLLSKRSNSGQFVTFLSRLAYNCPNFIYICKQIFDIVLSVPLKTVQLFDLHSIGVVLNQLKEK